MLRLASLDQSLYADELFLYAIVHDRSLGDVLSTIHDTEKTPPLGFLLSWLVEGASSTPELVRIPSFLGSVATVPLVYLLGLRTVGRSAGLVAAAWFALSSFEIFYGTEARSYALVSALVVLSTLSLLAALDEPSRFRWWALYVLAATAAVYTHYIAAMTLVPQAAWALWRHRESARRQLIAGGLGVLAFLPWLPSFLVQARHSADEAKGIDQVAPLTLPTLAEMSTKALAGHPLVRVGEIPGRAPLVILGAVLVALVLGAFYEWSRRGRRLGPALATPRGLLVLLALAPLVGLALYSLQPDKSFLLARNLSVAVPYALLMVGWLLTYPRRPIAIALTMVALVAMAVGTVKTLSPDHQRPDARSVARYIEANAAPTTPIVEVWFPFVGAPAQAARIYLRRPHPVYDLSRAPAAWAAADRARSPIIISFPGDAGLGRLLVPPPPYDAHYRLVAEHTSPGLRPLIVREYAPR